MENYDDSYDTGDIHNHQSLRIKDVITHPRYKKKIKSMDNDIALIQLYPQQEDGQCITFNDYVQPACLQTGAVN